MKQTSLPFRIKGVFEGLAESNGLLILSGNELKIQIQTKDQLVGLIKTNVKEHSTRQNQFLYAIEGIINNQTHCSKASRCASRLSNIYWR